MKDNFAAGDLAQLTLRYNQQIARLKTKLITGAGVDIISMHVNKASELARMLAEANEQSVPPGTASRGILPKWLRRRKSGNI